MKFAVFLIYLRAIACLTLLFIASQASALVYCITNAVDLHQQAPTQQAPTGDLAQSGWYQTVPINTFLGTIIHSNALLTAAHIWEITTNDTFVLEGTHRLTAKKTTAGSDLAIYFFAPPITNLSAIARINIDTACDTNARVVYQGRGTERGADVLSGALPNGWMWSATNWWKCSWGTRRWGINQTYEATADGLCAIASFDNTGDPDECMFSIGDSGGPGFIQTGSGWKLAMVNYSVYPSTFTYSTNAVSEFNATLFDCAGLYFKNDNSVWEWVPPEASPTPCLLIASRTATQITWITNTVKGLIFPADLSLAWFGQTNAPSRDQALAGIWFDVVLSNAGPYTAYNLVIDLEWDAGIRVKGSYASLGALATNRWSVPALNDGCVATLRVDTVVWTGIGHWTTHRATLVSSDKPDANQTNNTAAFPVYLPKTTATILWLK